MGNFFEKLKKGMGIENEEMIGVKLQSSTQSSIKKPIKKIEKKKKEKVVVKKPIASGASEPIDRKEIKVEKVELTKQGEKPETKELKKEKWFNQEGQLAVDIYQTKDELIIQSAIAGVKPDDLDISLENDVLSIKGQRQKSSEEQGEDYFVKECYWGAFSKEIVLPVETDTSRVKAEMKNGILIIRLPKIERERKRKVVVKE